MTTSPSFAVPTAWTEVRVFFVALGISYFAIVVMAISTSYRAANARPSRFLGKRDLHYLSRYGIIMMCFGLARVLQVLLNCLWSELPPQDSNARSSRAHLLSATVQAIFRMEDNHDGATGPLAVWVFKLVRPNIILGVEEALDTIAITLFFVLKCTLLFAWAYLVRVVNTGGPDTVYMRRLIYVATFLSSILLAGLISIGSSFIYGATKPDSHVLNASSLAGEAFMSTWSVAMSLGFLVFGVQAVRALRIAIKSRCSDDMAANAVKRSAMLQTIALVSFISFALRALINMLLLLPAFYDAYDDNAGFSCFVEFFVIEVLTCMVILLGFHRQLQEQSRFNKDEPLLAM